MPTHPFLVLGKNVGPRHFLAPNMGVFPSLSLMLICETLKGCSGLSLVQVKCCHDAQRRAGTLWVLVPFPVLDSKVGGPLAGEKGQEEWKEQRKPLFSCCFPLLVLVFICEGKTTAKRPSSTAVSHLPPVHTGPSLLEPLDPHRPHTLTFHGSFKAPPPAPAFRG